MSQKNAFDDSSDEKRKIHFLSTFIPDSVENFSPMTQTSLDYPEDHFELRLSDRNESTRILSMTHQVEAGKIFLVYSHFE